MELLAACEHRDATGINFCYTPKRQVTLLYTFYEVIEYQEQYIINLLSFHFIGIYKFCFLVPQGGGERGKLKNDDV